MVFFQTVAKTTRKTTISRLMKLKEGTDYIGLAEKFKGKWERNEKSEEKNPWK